MDRRPLRAAPDNVVPIRPAISPEFARAAAACRDARTAQLIARHRRKMTAYRLAKGVSP